MRIGIVGLGRMGAGMARRLAERGMSVLCYDQVSGPACLAGSGGLVASAVSVAYVVRREYGERPSTAA